MIEVMQIDELILTKLVRQARDAALSGKGVDVVVEAINEIEDYLTTPVPQTVEDVIRDMQAHIDMSAIVQNRLMERINELHGEVAKNVDKG